MATIRASAKTLILLLSLLLVSASTLALISSSKGGEEEQKQKRELEQCRQECRQQPHYDRGMVMRCEKQCEKQQEDPERRLEECKQECRKQGQQRGECERQCKEEYEREQEKGRGEHEDPEQRLEECKQECRQGKQQPQERWECERECKQEYEKERPGGKREGDPERRLEECRQECKQQGQQQEEGECERRCQQRYEEERGKRGEEEERRESNPYVFEQGSFREEVRTEQGSVRVLENFARRSPLLAGIANYRIAILEANPNTFVMPHHLDADALFYVVRGEGSFTQIRQDRDRQSSNIRQGDLFRVQAGTVLYLINRSSQQKLQIANIILPVSTPGQFEVFFTVGGHEPESYYSVFSDEILAAALNTRLDKLKRAIGQQGKGEMIEASPEQIRALSPSEHGSHWPFGGGESEGPFNLLSQRPRHSNDHGRLHEASPKDFQPLRDLNIRVSFANITRGSMMSPFFNSRATKIAFVSDGKGSLEMVCPHMSSAKEQWGEREEEHEQPPRGSRLQKVRAQLSRNTVFIAPPGHPIAIVASREQNLQVLCFEVNAENNVRMFLAGSDNIVSQLERVAKDLAFGVPSKLVDEVFGSKGDNVFVHGPESSQKEREEEEERRPPLESILGFAGF